MGTGDRGRGTRGGKSCSLMRRERGKWRRSTKREESRGLKRRSRNKKRQSSRVKKRNHCHSNS